MKKAAILLLSLLVAVGAFIFSFEVPAQAASIKLSKKSVTLEVGETKKIKVKGTKEKVTWKSSDKTVAKVSKKGKITAKGEGTCEITAKVGSKTLTCKVTVKAKWYLDYDASVEVSGVTFPADSSWRLVEDSSEKGLGVSAVGYMTQNMQAVSFEVAVLPGADYELATSSEEGYRLLGESFANEIKEQTGCESPKVELITGDGVIYVRISGDGTVNYDGYEIPVGFISYFKLQDGKFILSMVMEMTGAVADSDALAFETCMCAKNNS